MVQLMLGRLRSPMYCKVTIWRSVYCSYYDMFVIVEVRAGQEYFVLKYICT